MKKQNLSLWHAALRRFASNLQCFKFADHQIGRWLAVIMFGLLWIGTANDVAAQNLPIISVTPDAATAVEGSTDASFTLSADPAPTAELTVTIAIREAIGNFTTIGNSGSGSIVTFNSGEASVTYTVSLINDDTDEPNGLIDVAILSSNNKVYRRGSMRSANISLIDDDPTIVTLARTGSSMMSEGGTVVFTVTLGRELVAEEIIDVPLAISGTGITTADWSLATKDGTGITLISETTAAPVVRFSGAAAKTATLTLTATPDNTPEAGGLETLTLALGPNDATATGFDFKDRDTNVGGGADPATDAANNTFNVTINDNAAPVIGSDAAVSVAEGTTIVLTVAATDADKDVLTYSISAGADSTQFKINQKNGALTFKAAPDFEALGSTDKDNIYEVEVTVTDGAYNTKKTFTVSVTDVNEPPMLAPTDAANIAEGTTDVLIVTATDVDAGTTLTYAISGGVDSARFKINQSNRVLTFKIAPDFENPRDQGDNNEYIVEITVSDGTNSATQTVTVTVTDVNDNDPMITSPATASVAENTIDVVTVTATDEDTGTTLTYSITGGTDSTRFSIDQSTGDLTFKTAPDFEAGSADGDDDYEVIVTVSDGTNMDMQTITVTVTDENDNTPIITSPATASIAENTTTVLTVMADDADAGTILNYSISGGADRALFSIDQSTGDLTFKMAPDFESASADGDDDYEVIVTVSDGTNTDMQMITVTITNDPSDDILGFSEAEEVRLYPNPASNYFTLTGISGRLSEISLISTSGKVVRTYPTSQDGVYNVSALGQGIFFVFTEGDEGQKYAGRIVIRR